MTAIKIEVDEKFIQEQIQQKLDEAIQGQMWFMSADTICKLCDISKRFAEDEIFSDPRMKVIEIRKNRKRWYPAQKAYEIISEILSEW